jgi:hypothetical protein
MPHYFLEDWKNKWTLVRETASSQKLRLETESGRKFEIDVHYTRPPVLTVNIIYVSKEDDRSKSWLTPLMDDLASIALRSGDFAVIDYSFAIAPETEEGNFQIDKKMRKAMWNSLARADEQSKWGPTTTGV